MLGIFLDIETTGLDSNQHRVLEIAFKIFNFSTNQILSAFESLIFQSRSDWENSDPESLKVNGFTWDMVREGKKSSLISEQIIQIFNKFNVQRGNAVYVCQNPSFDRGFFSQIVDVYAQEKLNWPYHWLDFASMYWALEAKKAPFTSINLSKDSIARSCGLPMESHPHRAMNGVDHLLLCYQNVVGKERVAS